MKPQSGVGGGRGCLPSEGHILGFGREEDGLEAGEVGAVGPREPEVDERDGLFPLGVSLGTVHSDLLLRSAILLRALALHSIALLQGTPHSTAHGSGLVGQRCT